MAQARSIQIHAQEDADDVASPTSSFPTGLQAAVAFIADLTPRSERAGARGGIAAGGTRFAYQNLGNDPHGFGNNNYSQVRLLSLCVILETWNE